MMGEMREGVKYFPDAFFLADPPALGNRAAEKK